VDAERYAGTKKTWADFRRTLLYLRSEVRFYKEIVPELKQRGFDAVPTIYYAGYDLDHLIAEDECTTDQSVPEPKEWSARGKGGSIIMEYIGDPFVQASPLTLDQVKDTLSTVAALHASAWEDVELLQRAQVRLSRGSYHLKTRNVKELERMDEAWEHFSLNFQHLAPKLFQRTKDMGRQIQRLAACISEEVAPSPTSSYATLSHGDFKSMNCFFVSREHDNSNHNSNTTSSRGKVLLVDFASTGVGLGMSDVAMHIHHAVLPEHLADGGEERLLGHYLEQLNLRLGLSSSSRFFYPREVAMRHYRLAVVDYFRFFLGRFWNSATLETFAKKKESKNTALINRNIASALAFLDRSDIYLREIEAEHRNTLSGK
jgi:thiamine kinase-like enzyme